MKDVKCENCAKYNNEWCIPKFDSPDPNMLRDCEYFKQRTQYDDIVRMGTEELAKFLADKVGWDCNNCSEHHRLSDNPMLRFEPCDEKCASHCLEWLNKEVIR